MTIIDSTRFLARRPGGVQSPHVGECARGLDMSKQSDCSWVSAAGVR